MVFIRMMAQARTEKPISSQRVRLTIWLDANSLMMLSSGGLWGFQQVEINGDVDQAVDRLTAPFGGYEMPLPDRVKGRFVQYLMATTGLNANLTRRPAGEHLDL